MVEPSSLYSDIPHTNFSFPGWKKSLDAHLAVLPLVLHATQRRTCPRPHTFLVLVVENETGVPTFSNYSTLRLSADGSGPVLFRRNGSPIHGNCQDFCVWWSYAPCSFLENLS